MTNRRFVYIYRYKQSAKLADLYSMRIHQYFWFLEKTSTTYSAAPNTENKMSNGLWYIYIYTDIKTMCKTIPWKNQGALLFTTERLLLLVARRGDLVVSTRKMSLPRCLYPEDDGEGGSGGGRSTVGRSKKGREWWKFEARQGRSHRSSQRWSLYWSHKIIH